MFAYPLVMSYQHRYMADTRLATALYPGIRGYADFLKGMAERGKGPTKGLVTWKKYAPAACLSNTKGYSSTYLAMGFANVRAGTQIRRAVFGYPPEH